MSEAIHEGLRAKIALALECAASRPGGAFGYGFAIFPAAHPDNGARNCFWVHTQAGERMPLTGELLRTTAHEQLALWLYGSTVAALDPPSVGSLREPLSELIVHVLITPYGRPHHTRDYAELRTLVRTADVSASQPLVFVTRPGRPAGWPL